MTLCKGILNRTDYVREDYGRSVEGKNWGRSGIWKGRIGRKNYGKVRLWQGRFITAKDCGRK